MSILDDFKLTGKKALVTGCKRGIGRAMALALAEAGADIIGVSATLEPSGSEVEKQVVALGRKFFAYACDFNDRTIRLLIFSSTMQARSNASRPWNILIPGGTK